MWISGFIAIVILLSIAPVILGTTTLSDCGNLTGYAPKGGPPFNSTHPEFLEGSWSEACNQVKDQSVQAFELLIVVLIVMAAAVILRVVGFIGA